jgi:hypothetical protein
MLASLEGSTWAQLARKTPNGTCWHASTQQQSHRRRSTIRLLAQPTAASSTSAAVASQHFPTFIYSVLFTINSFKGIL